MVYLEELFMTKETSRVEATLSQAHTTLLMLQEKKITSEQADKLLAALEGGE